KHHDCNRSKHTYFEFIRQFHCGKNNRLTFGLIAMRDSRNLIRDFEFEQLYSRRFAKFDCTIFFSMKKLFALILLSFTFSNLFAQAGVLDSTFGTNGKVTTDFSYGGFVTDLAIQTDGKIVAFGYNWIMSGEYVGDLARYNADGTVDSSFAYDGTEYWE